MPKRPMGCVSLSKKNVCESFEEGIVLLRPYILIRPSTVVIDKPTIIEGLLYTVAFAN